MTQKEFDLIQEIVDWIRRNSDDMTESAQHGAFQVCKMLDAVILEREIERLGGSL